MQPQGKGFSAVRVSVWAILVINRVRFLHTSLELGTFLEATFSSLFSKTIN